MLGDVPTRGSAVVIGSYRFEVVDLDGRRVDQILIERIEHEQTPLP
ncbi:transporter associated domain-containing protein [Exiguobacterium sp.]|nr:transporter associated domain-containing protein [Exiguobacterium sp.]